MKKWSIWIWILLGAIFVVWLLHCFAFSSYVMLSSDMKSTLLPGERIIVNKWSYGLRTPYMSLFGYHRWGERPIQRGDVVVFNNPLEQNNKTIDKKDIFIYRCLAGPGDTLSVDSIKLLIPYHGCSITVNNTNRTLLCNMLNLHEKKKAIIRHDTLFVDNKPIKSYIFQNDYYWMVSDNASNISDSHYFGFVPFNHIIGRATFIWFSKDNQKNIFNGYRWNRFFKTIKPYKE